MKRLSRLLTPFVVVGSLLLCSGGIGAVAMSMLVGCWQPQRKPHRAHRAKRVRRRHRRPHRRPAAKKARWVPKGKGHPAHEHPHAHPHQPSPHHHHPHPHPHLNGPNGHHHPY